ncbi:uncharacterized protein DNG_03827 [Cephalotrichum gorgonifer]|uniref:Uncharacterized protein n=1 Tax=Cephalotrichum gorgonifer TaxID=2041049 RepID=A0AAE8STY2_9PEZI|nr:uncharacterized protein DNG_03827 [Cephalotrichum gorgonifer]
MKLDVLISILGLLSAATSSLSLHPRADDPPLQIIIGAPGRVMSATLPATEGFEVKGNVSLPEARPSWLLYHPKNDVLYAADETSTSILHFKNTLPASEKLTPFDSKTTNFTNIGSSGVVHLTFNKDKTRMLGCSESWAENVLVKPQQAVLSPGDDFFAVNDPGADAIFFINANDADEFALMGRVNTTDCGPRHGVFHHVSRNSGMGYTVVCQTANQLWTYKLTYDDKMAIHADGLPTTTALGIGNSTLLNGTMPSEVILDSEGTHLYVSIQNAGGVEDNILLFSVNEDRSLVYEEIFGAGGRMPQMMSLSKDNKVLFVANLKGRLGLVAWERYPKDGRLIRRLTESQISYFTSEMDSGDGPRFIMEMSKD